MTRSRFCGTSRPRSTGSSRCRLGARAARAPTQVRARPRPAAPRPRRSASRRSPFVLVLDGADLLARDSISAVGALVDTSRRVDARALGPRPPELPLAALRAGGPLLELGSDELALSRREAELLLRAARLELADAEITELVERSEGWAAGLYLAALAMRDESDERQAAGVRSVTGDDRYLADYFRSEYLSRPGARAADVPAPHLGARAMSGPLCDAMLDRKGSALELEKIERANLFLVPLDNRREWYRYHHLFRDLLRRELVEHEPELVPILHSGRPTGSRRQGDAESALEHAPAAGDPDRAARS